MLFCGSKFTKKNGTRRGKQLYKCSNCLRQFEGGQLLNSQALSIEQVRYETNALYLAQVNHLKAKGIEIQSIICDVRKELSALFSDISVQLCQFHQVKTVIRYLTRKLKSVPSQDLLSLTLAMKKAFEIGLEHKGCLNERSINQATGKSGYRHRRLRSAYLSLKRSLP